MSDGKYELPSKWEKLISKMPEWKDAADSKSTEELQREILKAQGIIADLEIQMDEDQKLTALKEDLKIVTGGYRDAMNSEKAKSVYSLFVLRQRGVR